MIALAIILWVSAGAGLAHDYIYSLKRPVKWPDVISAAIITAVCPILVPYIIVRAVCHYTSEEQIK